MTREFLHAVLEIAARCRRHPDEYGSWSAAREARAWWLREALAIRRALRGGR